MKRTCSVCGKEYEVKFFRLDWGNCGEHPVSEWFEVAPSGWDEPTPEATRVVWAHMVRLHVALFLFFAFCLGSVLCSVGYIGEALGAYAMAVLLYFAVRFAIAGFRGYPVLTVGQKLWLLWMPLWGPVLAMVFMWVGQVLRYGGG